jgi:NAD(P)H-hydrate epimerase
VARHPVTLLYKGARTLIAGQGGPVAHNTTGHPGLATGGVGDVLTGLLTSFLARGIPPYSAACLGSWLIGHAAELATQGSRSGPEGIVASDLPQLLPQALAALRRGAF